MELKGERLIPATPDTTWAALNDPETLKACIAGCESLERTGDDEYLATVALRVGPVNARFKGRLKLQNVVPPTSYTIAFDGQGGAAGFGRGSADVHLSPDPGGTRLSYDAKTQVGGKLAQVGSRLIDGAAAKITDDFFSAFESRLSAGAQAADETMREPGVVSAAQKPPAAGRPATPQSATMRWLPWVVAIIVIAALIAYFSG